VCAASRNTIFFSLPGMAKTHLGNAGHIWEKFAPSVEFA
jgi:hypothetical protein